MKMFKYISGFLLLIGLGISSWIYYPQYQIQKMKKQAINVNTASMNISYLDYFQNTEKKHIYNLAIGDSIIRGVGAPKNEDLVYQFSTKLENQIRKEIIFQNKGINGITSGELNELVQQGQFDEEIKKSDIITVCVGGNDILRLVKGKDFYQALQAFDQLQSDFSKNLVDISARIRMLNPNATIVFLELYNPLSLENQMYPLANKLLPMWNLKIYEVASQHSTSLVVQTTKVINEQNLQNLSPDGIHPNSLGYMAISQQIMFQLKHQYRKVSV